MNGGPVTVVASRVVSDGHHDRFLDWAARTDAAAARHEGHGGNIRLEQAGGMFHLVCRFDTQAQLDSWERSETYRDLLREIEDVSVTRRQVKTGRDAFFTLPGDGSGATWKKAAMTWAAAFPTLLLVNFALDAVLPATIPKFARLAISSVLLVSALNWLILPRVTRVLKPWQLSNDQGELTKPGE